MFGRLSRFSLYVAFASAGICLPAVHATAEEANVRLMEEIVTLGTRSVKERSASDSPVPVDVISGEDFTAVGNTADLTDFLKASVPSYTATPATGDGSAFVRPTSLRGTAPDQTLILVNGKRRHRSALVQFFAPAAGNGAHGVDVGMIPGLAVERVEVLRDGAASQYGSDAIAGVINIITKDASEGGTVEVQHGHYFDGEDTGRVAANVGLPLGRGGYLNLTLEAIENDALSRGVQRPDAQALIDSGVLGVGADAPFGDTPLVQTWGRPETRGTRFLYNGSVEIIDSVDFYFFGNYADTEGRYRFFYRNPNHSSLAPLREEGFTGLPAGYTPFLDGDQTDYSVVTGVEGVLSNDWTYDVSISYGENELEYFLNNTINQDLGLVNGRPAQRDFDVGGYIQEELNLNLDISAPLSATMNLAFGAEWREETYIATAGEPNSYRGAGSNGLKGISLQDAGDFDRDNYALYADLEHDVSDALLMQYALRYEDFSDFGDTINGKVAARYRLSDTFALRGAVSTGFHAPTPGQANVRTTITTFDGRTGLQVEEGLVPSTSPLVARVGGTELKEEESFNISAGFTFDLRDNVNITLDAYMIEVEDRIYRTRDIALPGTTNTISFYTNAIDVDHKGADLVITSDFDWSNLADTSVTFAYSYNKVDVVGQSKVGGVEPVDDSLVEDIENNYPESRFVLSANTFFSDSWNLLLRANYYGDHYDERGRIGARENPSAKIDPTIYVDLELGYRLNEKLRFVLGGTNIFDEFVDKIGPGNANRLSVGLPYPRRSAANYEGGSWYLSARYDW